jgi:hypothetical protein
MKTVDNEKILAKLHERAVKETNEKFRNYIDKEEKDSMYLSTSDQAPKEWGFYQECQNVIKSFEDTELQCLNDFISLLKLNTEEEGKAKDLLSHIIHNYRQKMSKILINVAFLERKFENLTNRILESIGF